MSKIEEYRVKICYEKDHVWAEVEDLPGCFASGRDLDELKDALAEAIGMYLSSTPGECTVNVISFDPPAAHRPVKHAQAVKHVPVRAELVPA